MWQTKPSYSVKLNLLEVQSVANDANMLQTDIDLLAN